MSAPELPFATSFAEELPRVGSVPQLDSAVLSSGQINLDGLAASSPNLLSPMYAFTLGEQCGTERSDCGRDPMATLPPRWGGDSPDAPSTSSQDRLCSIAMTTAASRAGDERTHRCSPPHQTQSQRVRRAAAAPPRTLRAKSHFRPPTPETIKPIKSGASLTRSDRPIAAAAAAADDDDDTDENDLNEKAPMCDSGQATSMPLPLPIGLRTDTNTTFDGAEAGVVSQSPMPTTRGSSLFDQPALTAELADNIAHGTSAVPMPPATGRPTGLTRTADGRDEVRVEPSRKEKLLAFLILLISLAALFAVFWLFAPWWWLSFVAWPIFTMVYVRVVPLKTSILRLRDPHEVDIDTPDLAPRGSEVEHHTIGPCLGTLCCNGDSLQATFAELGDPHWSDEQIYFLVGKEPDKTSHPHVNPSRSRNEWMHEHDPPAGGGAVVIPVYVVNRHSALGRHTGLQELANWRHYVAAKREGQGMEEEAAMERGMGLRIV